MLHYHSMTLSQSSRNIVFINVFVHNMDQSFAIFVFILISYQSYIIFILTSDLLFFKVLSLKKLKETQFFYYENKKKSKIGREKRKFYFYSDMPFFNYVYHIDICNIFYFGTTFFYRENIYYLI